MQKTILVTTYSPCIHGSYGIVSKEIFMRIFATGKYRIVHHGWFHLDPVDSVPWQVIPTMNRQGANGQMELLAEDNFGQKSFAQIMEQVKPDIVWALGDFYMLKHVFDIKHKYPTVPFIVHMAVDGEPWHPGITNTFGNADHVVAISQFGADAISTSMNNRTISYIHHGVNPNIFVKKSEDRRKQLKAGATGGRIKPTDFVIGWVGKDQFRKQVWKFWELIHYMVYGDYIECNVCGKITLKEFDKQKGQPREVGRLRRYNPKYDYSYCYACNSRDIKPGVPQPDVYGWSHMGWHNQEGWDPNQLSSIWKVKDHLYSTNGITPNKGLPINSLVDVYNLFDTFYCMSGGEGFGLPVLEAMSCEIPVVYTNYSAHAEVVGDAGIAIETDFTCEINSCFDRAHANTADAVKQMLKLKKDKDLQSKLGSMARQRAISMSWDAIGKQWLDYIDSIAANVNHSYGVIL